MLRYRSSLSPPPCILLSLIVGPHCLLLFCCQVPSASHVSNQSYFIHSPVSTANVHPFAIPGSVRPMFDSKDYQRSFLGSARISQQILIVKYLRPVTPLCSSRYSESLRVIVRYTASCPMLFANLNVVSSCTHLMYSPYLSSRRPS